MGNLYSVLGLSAEASPAAIKAAYYGLAKQYHPDTHPGETAQHRIRDINHAYRTLSDPLARAAYDLMLERHRSVAHTRFWKSVAVGAISFGLTLGSVPLLLWQQHPLHQQAIAPSDSAAAKLSQGERSSALSVVAAHDRWSPSRGDEIERSATSSSSAPSLPEPPSPPGGLEDPSAELTRQSQRSAAQDVGPLLALGIGSDDERRENSLPPPSVHLDPGSVRSLRRRVMYEWLIKRAIAKRREHYLSITVPGRGGYARDYRALRGYVLRK